ncbi:metallophosphoesterase [Gloeocapsa sp. PCC 73106]|uniref:metallophosphoesterase n=1 Tax=Gloeocapsa sp. PCC 73106 TaxID=102232 RepID=UPI0002F0C430|nr:metallophosphoesterase [Gloeocapsa sp. PCC 73106]
MVVQGSNTSTIDLTEVFRADRLPESALRYTIVENSNPAVVTASNLEEGLVLEYGEIGFSDLAIEAQDTRGNSVIDKFRIWVTGEQAFTIAILPDTQNYTSNPELNQTFFNMTQWLVDNQENLNLDFVIHVGDITDDNLVPQWDEVAEPAMRLLDGIIPYSVLPGNHDIGPGGTSSIRTTELYNRAFPVTRYQRTETFGGVYDVEPRRYDNNYHQFTAPDGTQWLIISLEFGPRDDVLRWANDVIAAHPNHRVIMATHDQMSFDTRHDPLNLPLVDEGAGTQYGLGRDPQGANDGESTWQEFLRKHPNISFTFNGHIFGDGAETQVAYGDYGNPVYQMLVNYQNGVSTEITGNGDESRGGNGGNGALRLLTIDPTENRFSTATYFVNFDEYLTGYRVQPELDRDGLTGPYRGHQDVFENVYLGPPQELSKANAGEDQVVNTNDVTLDGTASRNESDSELNYQWFDGSGNLIATGATPDVILPVGKHNLTLQITDGEGVVNQDEVLIAVRDENTLLWADFNDGSLVGWSPDEAISLEELTEFGLLDIANDEAQVMSFPATTPNQGYLFKPNTSGAEYINKYTLIFDLFVPSTSIMESGWLSLLQTDVSNSNDAELFIRQTSANTGGIGISGEYEGNVTFDEWHRIAVTFDLPTSTLSKYIDGVKVGTQTLSEGRNGRWAIKRDDGALLFADENNETAAGFTSSIFLREKVLTDAEIAQLGTPEADGIATQSQRVNNATQFDFTSSNLDSSFGLGTLNYQDTTSPTGTWLIQGTVFSRPEAEDREGRLIERSDSLTQSLYWNNPEALSWQNYVFDVTVLSTDDDAIGVLFYYQDSQNHYKLILDTENNERTLVKVKDGQETILASQAKGYPFNLDLELRIAITGNQIIPTLDGQNIFDEAIVDAVDPLTQGTIGLYSQNQEYSSFDNIMVNPVTLTANAGVNQRLADVDGDGLVAVELNAENSFSLAEIQSYSWSIENEILATGENTTANLPVGDNLVTLTLEDREGNVSVDQVQIAVYPQTDVLLWEDFQDGEFSDWTVEDEGEFDGPSAWEVSEDRLMQSSNINSRQLQWSGASNSDVWQRGWSPLGDGWMTLRQGTYAYYNSPEAVNWRDYSLEATVANEDNEGIGVLFYYQDPDNYYKLELDANQRFTQLFQRVDGVETTLARSRNHYALNTDTHLRVDIDDNRISAWMDGERIFNNPIEDRQLTEGTVALYSWGSQGASFDDITVLDLNSANSVFA